MLQYKIFENEAILGIKGEFKKIAVHIFNVKFLYKADKKKLMKSNPVFWTVVPNVDVSVLGSPLLQKMMMFLQEFPNFGIILLNERFAAPVPTYYKAFVGNIPMIIVSDEIGSNIIINGEIEENNGSPAERYLAKNTNSSFIYDKGFFENLKYEIAEVIDFVPQEYAVLKRQIYFSIKHDLTLLGCPKRENIYVAGPPGIGKTLLAKQIAEEWNYVYVNNKNQLETENSYVFDVDPVVAADYGNCDRIFLLCEDCDENREKMIVIHNYKVNIALGKVKSRPQKNFIKIQKYYKNRSFPDTKIERLYFLPGEIYRNNLWEYYL